MSKTVFIKIAILAFISAFIIPLFPAPSHSENQTITHPVKQPFLGQFLKGGLPNPLKMILPPGMDLTEYMKRGG